MSTTELCNEALQIIGTRSSIVDIGENSNEAKACLIAFEPVRKKLMRAAPWGFNKTAERLSLVKALPGTPENPATAGSTWTTAMPQPGWLYTYGKPAACERMRYVVQDVAGQSFINYAQGGYAPTLYPWRFSRGVDRDSEGNQVQVISTNARGAIGVYSLDVPDDDQWESDFREAFVHALASRLAIALTADKNAAKMAIQLTNQRITDAMVNDANEYLTTYDTIGTAIAARDQLFNPAFGEQFPVP